MLTTRLLCWFGGLFVWLGLFTVRPILFQLTLIFCRESRINNAFVEISDQRLHLENIINIYCTICVCRNAHPNWLPSTCTNTFQPRLDCFCCCCSPKNIRQSSFVRNVTALKVLGVIQIRVFPVERPEIWILVGSYIQNSHALLRETSWNPTKQRAPN